MVSDNAALGRPIPVSVITGFLGSGKTTLLSRLLADKRMNNAAVIINEFGEVGLDHQLLKSPREDKYCYRPAACVQPTRRSRQYSQRALE